LCVEPGLYGVHFIDRQFKHLGAEHTVDEMNAVKARGV